MSSRRKRRRPRVPGQAPPPARAPTPPRPWAELDMASSVTRLAYSRRQAAEALGVSITTIDRRVVPAIDTVKTPWGQRLIPVDELERFVDEHLEAGLRRTRSGTAGRPPVLPQAT